MLLAGGWRAAAGHLRREWRAVLAAACSFAGYPATSHLPGLKARTMPDLALDRAIPLLPWTAYVYVSLYPLLLFNLAYLLPRPRALRALADAVTLANAGSSAIFALWRTAIERPPLAPGPGAKLLAGVRRIDPPYNAMPSLHVAYGVLLAWAHLRLQSPPAPALALWSAAVVASTLSTKQHRSLDLLGGAALALLAGAPTIARLSPADWAPRAAWRDSL
ncbi:MAG TPA: phosphatase PAP2 family protein [Herpetosiphonaceae bacterium]